MTRPSMLRIGTRGSRLARWQATWVADRLREAHPGLDLVITEIHTQGDRDRNSPLATIGGAGVFTKEIQRAVLERSVDLAVHSLKDLPTATPDGLILAAVPVREDVADALIAPVYRTLEELPAGSKIGTSSLRRRAQVLYLRPDLSVISIRGNVETRLNQAREGKLDAVILACAGLDRLGLTPQITARLAPPKFLPAVGQGALGLECRIDDEGTRLLLSSLDDPSTHRAVRAERAALAELNGGCLVPIAAWAREVVEGSARLGLDGAVFDPEGHACVRASLTGPREKPEILGRQVAQQLREQGAEALLGQIQVRQTPQD